MNFRVAPSLTYQLTVLGVMLANLIFCYVWEVSMPRPGSITKIITLVNRCMLHNV